VRFSAPVQTGPGAHPASYTMGTGSLSLGVKRLGVALTTHPDLKPILKRVEMYSYSPFWVFMACSRTKSTCT